MNKLLSLFALTLVFKTFAQPIPRPIPGPLPIPPIQRPELSFLVTTGNGPLVKVSNMAGGAAYTYPLNFGKAHVAINPVNKNIYVQPSGGILYINAPLAPTGWNVGPTDFAGSTGLAFDQQGNAYSANCSQGIIFQYNFQTKIKTSLGGFNCPENVKVDNAGRIYVTGPNALYIVDNISGANRRMITAVPNYNFAGGYFSGLDLDNKGRVYLINSVHNRAIRINDINSLQFDNIAKVGNSPKDISVDKFGRIYVTYPQSNEIKRIDDVAGNGEKRFFLPVNVDGQATTAAWRVCPLAISDNTRPQ